MPRRKKEDEIALAGVNFIIILRAAFLVRSVKRSFYLFTVLVCNFLVKENQHKSGAKAAQKCCLN